VENYELFGTSGVGLTGVNGGSAYGLYHSRTWFGELLGSVCGFMDVLGVYSDAKWWVYMVFVAMWCSLACVVSDGNFGLCRGYTYLRHVG